MNATLKLAMRKSDAFNAIKLASVNVRQRAALNIIETIKLKQTKTIQLWLRNTKMKNALYSENSRIRQIQRNFMQKLLTTKAGKLYDAFRKWKGVPAKKDLTKYIKADQFEKGLR